MNYPRTNYEMTQADLDRLLDAMRSMPVMKIGNSTGSSQQERANDAWEALGKKMGFDYMTVRPIEGQDMRHFSAIPSETETQRTARVERERAAAREKEISELAEKIGHLTARLESLKTEASPSLSKS